MDYTTIKEKISELIYVDVNAINNTIIDLSARDLIKTIYKDEYNETIEFGVGISKFNDYNDGSLETFEQETMLLAHACLSIVILFQRSFRILPEEIKTKVSQYGEGDTSPASGEDIKRHINFWRRRAKSLLDSITAPNNINNIVYTDIIEPCVYSTYRDTYEE